MHAVSLGEMKALKPIYDELKKRLSVQFLVTTQTKTGYDYAQAHLDCFVCFQPFDFLFLQKKWVKKVDPDLFISIEGDFWFHHLSCLKQAQTQLFLLNGKISDRSFFRMKKVGFFYRKLFTYFDFFFVQDEEAKKKFSYWVPSDQIQVVGNIKFLKPASLSFKKEKSIVVACTHEPEEEFLYLALQPLIEQGWTLYVAPRHPERFQQVYAMLKKQNFLKNWVRLYLAYLYEFSGSRI